jgi:hypothetical protein
MQWPKAARDESDKATTWLFNRGDKERQRCIGDDGLYLYMAAKFNLFDAGTVFV